VAPKGDQPVSNYPFSPHIHHGHLRPLDKRALLMNCPEYEDVCSGTPRFVNKPGKAYIRLRTRRLAGQVDDIVYLGLRKIAPDLWIERLKAGRMFRGLVASFSRRVQVGKICKHSFWNRERVTFSPSYACKGA